MERDVEEPEVGCKSYINVTISVYTLYILLYHTHYDTLLYRYTQYLCSAFLHLTPIRVVRGI